MGKLAVSEFITLDGVIENPGGSEGGELGGWSFRHPAHGGQQFKSDELAAADVQLLGRVTYEGFAAAWPAMEEATGSATLVRSLAAHNLVDEYRLMVHPVVLGRGKRLFCEDFPVADLELAESRKAGPDVLVLIYRPATSHQPTAG